MDLVSDSDLSDDGNDSDYVAAGGGGGNVEPFEPTPEPPMAPAELLAALNANDWSVLIREDVRECAVNIGYPLRTIQDMIATFHKRYYETTVVPCMFGIMSERLRPTAKTSSKKTFANLDTLVFENAIMVSNAKVGEDTTPKNGGTKLDNAKLAFEMRQTCDITFVGGDVTAVKKSVVKT